MLAVWMAKTEFGYMTGDYITTVIAANRAVTVVPVATAPSGSTLHQSMYGGGVPVTGGSGTCDVLNSSAMTPQADPVDKSKKNYHTGS